MFYKVRDMTSTWRLEVLMPETGRLPLSLRP
jgi:hypothetical protein